MYMGRVGLVFTKQYVKKNILTFFFQTGKQVVTCVETSLSS